MCGSQEVPELVADEAADAMDAIVLAAEQLPHGWVTPVLGEVSADGRTVRLDPPTRHGAVLWTDRAWTSAAGQVGQTVRFHEFTSLLLIGGERRLVRPGSAAPLGRAVIAPRRRGDVEPVGVDEWVSGWLAVGSADGAAGYARLSTGTAGEVTASFTLDLPDGFMSADSGPVTERFLRFDPARNAVDYIARIEGAWYLEATAQVRDDLAAGIGDCWPDVIFQYLVDASREFDVYPITVAQARELGWLVCFDDRSPPPLDHVWRPVDVSGL